MTVGGGRSEPCASPPWLAFSIIAPTVPTTQAFAECSLRTTTARSEPPCPDSLGMSWVIAQLSR